MNAKELILDLARTIESENEAAHDLWSWMPSHHFAEKGHKDYAGNHRPSNAMLLRESSLVFSILAGYSDGLDSPEYVDVFRCPCENCDVPTKEELEVFFVKYRK